MVRTARRQLRAYVSIDRAFIEFAPDKKWFDVFIEFKNSGQTPAYELTTSFHIEVWDVPVFVANYAPVRAVADRETSAIVGPGTTFTVRDRRPMTPGAFPLVEGGMKIIVVWGEVDYTDVFKVPQSLTVRATGKELPGRGWVLQAGKDGNKAT